MSNTNKLAEAVRGPLVLLWFGFLDEPIRSGVYLQDDILVSSIAGNSRGVESSSGVPRSRNRASKNTHRSRCLRIYYFPGCRRYYSIVDRL